MEKTENEEEEQRKRADARIKYLMFLSKLSGSQTDIEMYENTNVRATITAPQANSEHFIVSNLETPIGKVEKAVLRSSDIVRITVAASEILRNKEK
ncbi:unnamed protein product [Caenorhabditis angaria]|uniref:Gem-associated protein 7 n=1 Tax=Caenorhabditis angaria TaxID=860376 RepID=A0A9P1IJH2_9PELO|nr:unnamed protein product [Caenorhabditis angaria]